MFKKIDNFKSQKHLLILIRQMKIIIPKRAFQIRGLIFCHVYPYWDLKIVSFENENFYI